MDEWVSCKGSWKSSKLYEKMTARKSVRTKGARVWLTRHQLAAKYNDAEVAREICESKLSDPELKETHTKPHPDAPEKEAGLYNYYIYISLLDRFEY